MEHKEAPMWERPWSFAESFVVGAGLVLVGFSLEWANGLARMAELSWPANLQAILIFAMLVAVNFAVFRHRPWTLWLMSVPAAIASIVAFTFMALLMGLVPQGAAMSEPWRRLGMDSLTSSWPFGLTMLYLLATLLTVTLKRSFPFRWRNLGFILNHLGLWVAITAGAVGSADLQRLSMVVEEGKGPVWYADDGKQIFEMPLAIELLDFEIEEYVPKIAFMDVATGELLEPQNQHLFSADTALRAEILGWSLRVLEFLPTSGRMGETFFNINDFGSAAAARVLARHADGRQVEGWVGAGNALNPYHPLRLDERHALLMLPPEAKEFRSKVSIFTASGERLDTTVRVNQPVVAEGWSVYQLSYDETYGRWSAISVLELVRDPWLPVVYTGIYMMFAGALYMLWLGKGMKISPAEGDAKPEQARQGQSEQA